MNSEDRRIFSRYKKETEFKLSLDGNYYNCRTIDYSADGISLYILDTNLSLLPGTTVDIRIEDPEIELLGEVIWARQEDAGVKVGFKRVGNIRGSCHDFQMADILIGLQRSTKTGILEVIFGHKLTNIYIKNGDLKFANSSHQDDRFGELLLRKGKITLEQFFEVSEQLKKTGKRLGTILVESGYLNSNDLFKLVRQQVEEIIVNILTTECGKFEFKECPLPTDEAITLNLSAANLIYQGVKRINSLHHILMDFPSLDDVLCLSHDPLDLFQDISLDDTDKEILSFMQDDKKVRAILADSPVNNFETVKTIYALMCIKIIVKKRYDTPPSASPEEIISEPHLEIEPEFLEKVNNMCETYKTLGYYDILGVQKTDTPKEIKNAYFRLAREFHPDRHFALESDDIKGNLNNIFTYISTAYNTLSDTEKRKQYDKSLDQKPQRAASNDELALECFNRGKSKMMTDNIAEAEKLFVEAIYYDSSNASYHYYHGLVLNKLNILKKAVDSFNKAIELNPNKADYFAELGHVFLKLDFQLRAKKSFESALTLSPSCDRALEGIKKLNNK